MPLPCLQGREPLVHLGNPLCGLPLRGQCPAAYDDPMLSERKALRREGYPVQEEDLVHLWPTRFAYVHCYGKGGSAAPQCGGGLGPLRSHCCMP
jgi:hypothetical protein